MKETINDIGKRMPYQEGEDYVNDLLDRVTEQAINSRHRAHRLPRWVVIPSAAAVALLVIGIGTKLLTDNSRHVAITEQTSGPIDEFLNSLSDEEVAQLPYFEIEEIPEY